MSGSGSQIRALIIAVENYPQVAALGKKLPGTHAAALHFRDWLLGVKSVDPKNIFFCTDDPSLVGRTSGATATEISHTIYDLVNGGKNRTKELFVFFSGHGLRYEDHPAKEPVDIIVAADFVTAGKSGNECRKLDEIRQYLRTHLGPGEHFYFVDACRNMLKAKEIRPGGLGLGIERTKTGDADPFVLFSTRPGSFAKVASGFSDILLAGLKGMGKAKVRANGDAVVSFSSLVGFIRGRLTNQEVEHRLGEGVGEIYRIQPAPKYNCEIEVEGAKASDIFQVQLETTTGIPLAVEAFLPGGSFEGRRGALKGVPFDRYILGISHPSGTVEPAKQTVELFADCQAAFRLVPPDHAKAVAPLAESPIPSTDLATVTVQTSPGAYLAVHDLLSAETLPKIQVTDQHHVTRRYAPGNYFFTMMAPNGRTLRKRHLRVRPHGDQSLSLRPTSDHRVSRAIRSQFGDQSWNLDFSETLGTITEQDLGVWLSILGASRIVGGSGDFPKMEQVPLASFEEEKPGDAPLYVLAALKGTKGNLAVGLSSGTDPDWMACEKVDGFPGLQHLKIDTLPGPALFSFRKLGGAPVTIASHTLADRATLITLSDEKEGELRIHQYLLPIHSQAERHPGVVRNELQANPLETVKFLAQAQRRFMRAKKVEPDKDSDSYRHWRKLLSGKWLDPMTAIIAAYELIRRGRTEDMKVVVLNLRRHFADIPDSEVLASLSDLEHDKPATTPLLLDGLLALKGYEELLPLPVGGLDFSMVWTSWIGAVTRRRAAKRETAPQSQTWLRVPDGSRLDIGVSGEENAVAATAATLTVLRGGQVFWTDLHLKSPAKKHRLKAAKSYYLKLEVVFARRAEVEVEITIRKPDGTTHGKPLRQKLAGTAGERVYVSGYIKTLST